MNVAQNKKTSGWWTRNWVLVMILGLALALRLPYLNGSFWLDEAAQALESSRNFASQILITDDFQPPLLHYLLYFAINLGGTSEWWLRLVGALIPALLTILGTYILGKKLFNKPVGLVAALFLATNSFHIYLSQELRPYSLSAFWAIWSWIFLLEYENVGQQFSTLKRDGKADKFWRKVPFGRNFVGFIFCTLGGLFTSYLYPFIFLTQLIFLACKRAWTKIILALGLSGAVFLIWLPSFWAQFQAGSILRISFPGWDKIVSFGPIRSIALTAGKFIFGWRDLSLSPFFIISLLILIILVGFLLWQKAHPLYQTKKIQLGILLLGFFGPFILAWLISFFVPVIQPKRVIYLLPFLEIFWAVLIFGWPKIASQLTLKNWLSSASNWPATLFFLFILFLNGAGIWSYWTDINVQREDWRRLYTEIRQDWSSTNSLAVFSYLGPYSPWTWYENQALANGVYLLPFPTFSTGTYDADSPDAIWKTELPRVASNYKTILLWDYLRDLTDPQRQLDQVLTENNFVEVDYYDYPQIGLVRIWQKKEG